MKLYYAPQTRATRPRWMLEEIGAPYELVRLQLSKGEHKQPEYLRVHPHGAVPAFADEHVTLFESGAICAYLADTFPEKQLAPAAGSAQRGPYYQWLFYSMATMEPPVLKVFLNTREDIERIIKYIRENPIKAGREEQIWDFVRKYDGWLPRPSY